MGGVESKLANLHKNAGEAAAWGKKQREENKHTISNGGSAAGSQDSRSEGGPTDSGTGVTTSVLSHGANFKWLGDRMFLDTPYILPADEKEWDRNTTQQFMFVMVFGAYILAPIQKRLAKNQNVTFLDIGCGPGCWSMGVAKDNPNINVVGIDIMRAFPADVRPPNCKFEIVDALKWPMPFDDRTFDLIHINTFSPAIPKSLYSGFIAELLRLLKPGGYLQWVEPDFQLWQSGPYCNETTNAFSQAMALRDLEPHLPRRWKNFLKEAGFIRISQKHSSLPLGKWGGQLGAVVADDYIQGFDGMSSFFSMVFGWSEDDIRNKSFQVRKEMDEYKGYLNCHLILGMKALDT